MYHCQGLAGICVKVTHWTHRNQLFIILEYSILPKGIVLCMTLASSDDEAKPEPEHQPDHQISGLDIFLTEFSSNFRQAIVDGYKDNSQFSKALVAGVESGIYVLRNGLLYLAMPGVHRLCIPNTKDERGRGKEKGKRNLCEMLMAHAHEIAGHLGLGKSDKSLETDDGRY